MKKLILITILIPIISFSQTYYDSALNFQNEVRNYYDLTPSSYDSDLSLKACQKLTAGLIKLVFLNCGHGKEA